MVQTAADSLYDQLKSELARGAGDMSIAEPSYGSVRDPEATVDERLVQAIWNEQLFAADSLVTCSGKPVRVIDAGQWNGEGGPDFRTAELEIDGKRMRGDVEIHVHSADWDRHGHSADFAYNSVVLHAFLHKTDGANFDELQNGRKAERIELIGMLSPDLETIRRSLTGDDLIAGGRNTGACSLQVAALDPDFLRRFFDAAARQRMEQKIARFAAQSAGESLDQALYQAVMTAMGYKGGKTLFFLLAKRTPIEELKNYLRNVPLKDLSLALEAVLLNTANLIPAPPEEEPDLIQVPKPDAACGKSPFDAETQAYLNELNRWWSELSGYFQDRVIPPTRRWYASVRPVNFPTRRISGIARLLANYDFRRGLMEGMYERVSQARARGPKSARDFKREIRQLAMIFAEQGGGYWSNRYTVGGKPAASAMKLIGDDRAASVLFNALLPMLFLAARRKEDPAMETFLWRLFDHFPSLPENAVTRFMSARLFGQSMPTFMNTRLEKFQQALFQVFYDCCGNHNLTCEDCIFRRAFPTGTADER